MPTRLAALLLVCLAGPRTAAGAGKAASPPRLTKAGEPPAEAYAQVRAQFPGARHVSAAGCNVGAGGATAYGLVFIEDGSARLQADHVRAAAVVRSTRGWTLQLFPDSVDVPGVGFQRGLFADFVQDGKLAQAIGVRCVVPGADADISPRMGKWLTTDKALRATRQLCFAISVPYNNWACFAYDAKKATFERSFAQLQAD